LDLEDGRLRQMDENGVEMMLLSLNAPSVQASWAPDQAKDLARRANDYLAEHVNKHPTRLQG
jgi:predicted TIM-barrel fold metal-dependent hydrolase